MSAQSLHLKSSKSLIKKELFIKGPIHIGIILVIIVIFQLITTSDDILTSIGLYFLALVIFWAIQIALVIPLTKNDILIDDKGILCSKIDKYGLDGFISWPQIKSLDIKYGHRSPTLLIDIHPCPKAIKEQLKIDQKTNKDMPDSQYTKHIRLRINFIDETDEDIHQFIESLGPR